MKEDIIVISSKSKKDRLLIREYIPNKNKPAWMDKGKYKVYNFKAKSKTEKCKKEEYIEFLMDSKTQVKILNPITKEIDTNLDNWKCIALFNSMLKEQLEINIKRKLFIKKDGSFEYFGPNPVGNLIMNYFSLNLINKKKKEIIRLKNFKEDTVFNYRIIDLHCLNFKWFETECMISYFEFFNPFFPVVDEKAFYKQPNLLLKKVIMGIGYKYLPNVQYDQLVMDQLDEQLRQSLFNNYFRPSIYLIISLVLITNFQVLINFNDKFWMFQNSSIKLSIMLGLNREVPKYLNLDKRSIRYRYHVWWGSCIHDKYYSLALNRPTTIRPEEWYLPMPKFNTLNKMPEIPNFYQVKIIKELASSLYWKCMAALSEIIGYINIFKNQRDKETIENLQLELNNILKKIEKSINLFSKVIEKVYFNQPSWVYEICNTFLLYIIMFANSLIIETVNIFIKLPLAKHVKYYEKRSMISAITILISSEKLGVTFIKYGVPFRFIAMGNATLLLASKLCYQVSKDCFYSKKELKALVEKGLAILTKAVPYNPVVREVIKIVKEMVELPGN